MTIRTTTLPNGLRVITDDVKSVDSVALGVWADVGTRDEDMAHNGVAHMVEHMMFKGTARRDAVKIAEEIEDVGGQMNAFTSREVTAYHIHLLKQDTGLAVDMLADMVQHSTLPPEEIDRERHVILQEIGMTNDTPDDLVFDNYQETAYPEQSLGAPILGRAEIIAAMTQDTMAGYIRNYYTPGRLVVSAAGHIDHDQFVATVEKNFNSLPPDAAGRHPPADYRGGEHRADKPLEQAHIVLGFRGIPRHDAAYYDVVALATILGGGMSSRLFQEVREKRGLAYSVFGSHSAYQDDGQFVVYAGTGPDDLPTLVPVLCEEIIKTFDTITGDEVRRAQAQMRASLVMGRESMMARANQQAKHLIHFGTVFDMSEKLRKIDAITIESVQKAARRIFTTVPTVAALGPLAQLEPRDKIVERLKAA